MSWAQAKTTQTNALITRLENGDAMLGVRMLAALPVFGAIRSIQLDINASETFKDDSTRPKSNDINPILGQIADTAIFSAEVLPWYLDKVVNEVRYDYSDIPVSGLAPVLEMMDALVTEGATAASGVVTWDRDEFFEGIIGVGETTIPFFKDFSRRYDWIERLQGDKYMPIKPDSRYSPIEEDTVYGSIKERRGDFKGGEISKDHPVPNAPVVPMERKDRMGSQSYATQASAEPINPFTGEPYTAIYKAANKG